LELQLGLEQEYCQCKLVSQEVEFLRLLWQRLELPRAVVYRQEKL